MSEILIEACVTSAASAMNAEKGGALRVELCENLIEGGTTPSAGMITKTREHISIGLFVMIRPRGGDFCYSEIEFETMKEDVKTAKFRCQRISCYRTQPLPRKNEIQKSRYIHGRKCRGA